ncbi:LOW QUALITY PROTEIN: hypothetical protein FOQG_01194 [Fusarium oxysporum f. sp. raphani 54005]|uniref:Uncharacterized protein n=2 Tax=Fusarium oxysporum TaxID=5507 RepID=X0CVR0_FUSOX|nr:LOW QUALITY PROTEIN: hypothetical protein FOQG_01194 [Fusarium oxysporum f. sp. raphani 54005]EXM23471.1 LOW QUALITY PROTEIN: hypothetical protein FOTG_09315 [Fusarium oxysporum f. sp. vasinfectum 25433]
MAPATGLQTPDPALQRYAAAEVPQLPAFAPAPAAADDADADADADAVADAESTLNMRWTSIDHCATNMEAPGPI